MKKINFYILLPVVIVLSVFNSAAMEITAASPVKTENGKKADFVFIGSVTVRNIAFEKGGIVMPVTEYKDRTYTDIKLLSRSLYAKLEACFTKDKCVSGVRPPLPKLSVSEVKTLKSKTRVANVSLAFDGDLVVTFGVIKKESGEIWAAYPANFEVADETLKDLIEKKVAEGFKNAPPESKKKSSGPVPRKTSK
ncbi:MAG: hypothetical protein A2270_02465 [Elusimicrobia bacterium RIFOXYA12_FULL_51_18]|nr:MAG: hypothetical protein A2270_02465 [Elusimicrobia bacterium RIFOXYA12_FULL_51_18]OGS31278.1 MAG: hypothetical protein A2218_08050 [Elusimicrobia bacterium RIFOXYA2_FULL_53_38]